MYLRIQFEALRCKTAYLHSSGVDICSEVGSGRKRATKNCIYDVPLRLRRFMKHATPSEVKCLVTRSMSHKLFAKRRPVTRLTAATTVQTEQALSKLLLNVSSWPYIFVKR